MSSITPSSSAPLTPNPAARYQEQIRELQSLLPEQNAGGGLGALVYQCIKATDAKTQKDALIHKEITVIQEGLKKGFAELRANFEATEALVASHTKTLSETSARVQELTNLLFVDASLCIQPQGTPQIPGASLASALFQAPTPISLPREAQGVGSAGVSKDTADLIVTPVTENGEAISVQEASLPLPQSAQAQAEEGKETDDDKEDEVMQLSDRSTELRRTARNGGVLNGEKEAISESGEEDPRVPAASVLESLSKSSNGKKRAFGEKDNSLSKSAQSSKEESYPLKKRVTPSKGEESTSEKWDEEFLRQQFSKILSNFKDGAKNSDLTFAKNSNGTPKFPGLDRAVTYRILKKMSEEKLVVSIGHTSGAMWYLAKHVPKK